MFYNMYVHTVIQVKFTGKDTCTFLRAIYSSVQILFHQSLGVLLTVAGFVLIFLVGSYSEPNYPHAIVGIILTAMLVQQFLNGIL